MKHDAWLCTLLWWSCQSAVAHSCSLLNNLNSFRGGMFKLNATLGAGLLLYLLSHFECNSHTVHMLTQWHLPSPVKLSLFMHARSSPLALAARLHRYRTNYSHHINNGWTFSGQTSYTDMSSLLPCVCTGWANPYEWVPRIIFQPVGWDLPCPIGALQLYPHLHHYQWQWLHNDQS